MYLCRNKPQNNESCYQQVSQLLDVPQYNGLPTIFISHQHLCLLTWCLIIAYILYMRYGSGLISVPGPSLASITDIWRAFAVSRGQFHLQNRKLHDQYGPLVRIYICTYIVCGSFPASASI